MPWPAPLIETRTSSRASSSVRFQPMSSRALRGSWKESWLASASPGGRSPSAISFPAMRSAAVYVVVLLALAGCGTCGGQGCGGRISSADLYFTRYAATPNLMKVRFDYSGGKFTLDKPKSVATLNGVDGLVFAPDGDLLVGGQGGTVHKVRVADGKFKDVKANTVAYHVSMDPSGKKAWVAGIPGPLAEIPLSPFGDGIPHQLHGDDVAVTSIAFDSSGHAYYTSSGSGGY